MEAMNIEQLRAASRAGGIAGVTLTAQGGTFLVRVTTRNGADALLTKARSVEPRQFGNPLTALNVLREVGITVGQFDATNYDPTDKPHDAGNRGRADAMRGAHEAAAHAKWLKAEIEASIDDPRPNLSHEDVMAEMQADIAALAKPARKTASRR